jgi:hypothetical protein
VVLKNELGARATLVTCRAQPTCFPLNSPETAASHMIRLVQQVGGKP